MAMPSSPEVGRWCPASAGASDTSELPYVRNLDRRRAAATLITFRAEPPYGRGRTSAIEPQRGSEHGASATHGIAPAELGAVIRMFFSDPVLR